MQTRNVLSSSPLSTDKSFMEEANFKVGKYSAEERKERIDRYRAKRTQRNFNKTIKVRNDKPFITWSHLIIIYIYIYISMKMWL